MGVKVTACDILWFLRRAVDICDLDPEPNHSLNVSGEVHDAIAAFCRGH